MTANAATLRRVHLARRPLDDYEDLAPASLLGEVVRLGRALDGARVLHVSAAPAHRSGAALVASELTLMRDLGVETEWRLICADDAFLAVANRIHDALRGRPLRLRPQDITTYLEHSRRCAAMLGPEWDIIVAHDPQSVALIVSEAVREDHFAWKCHIDLSHPEPATWDFLRPFAWAYDIAVFPLRAFVPGTLPPEQVAITAPAIDPFNPRNCVLPRHLSRRIASGFGVDLARPLAVEVTRLDRWSEPFRLLGIWLEARRHVPALQLALLAVIADHDPEAWTIHEQLSQVTRDEPDLHLLTNLDGLGPLDVNAFQREADVVLQTSRHGGLDPAVSEALWKETPVVGDDTAGNRELCGDDGGGILTHDEEALVRAIVTLLEDEELAASKGHAGRERVRRNFLLPRLVRDDLDLYRRLLDPRSRTQPVTAVT